MKKGSIRYWNDQDFSDINELISEDSKDPDYGVHDMTIVVTNESMPTEKQKMLLSELHPLYTFTYLSPGDAEKHLIN